MDDLWQAFADALTEGIRKHADESRERATLNRMDALCDHVDKMVAAKPTHLDEYVKRAFKPTKSHPQPVYVLTYGAIWPTDEDTMLEAFKKAGFQVTKTGRVFATPTKAERMRCGVHFHNTWRRERMLRKYLRIYEELLNDE